MDVERRSKRGAEFELDPARPGGSRQVHGGVGGQLGCGGAVAEPAGVARCEAVDEIAGAVGEHREVGRQPPSEPAALKAEVPSPDPLRFQPGIADELRETRGSAHQFSERRFLNAGADTCMHPTECARRLTRRGSTSAASRPEPIVIVASDIQRSGERPPGIDPALKPVSPGSAGAGVRPHRRRLGFALGFGHQSKGVIERDPRHRRQV